MAYGVYPLVSVAKRDLTVPQMLTVLSELVTNGHALVLMDMKVMDIRAKTSMNVQHMLILATFPLVCVSIVILIINARVKRVTNLLDLIRPVFIAKLVYT